MVIYALIGTNGNIEGWGDRRSSELEVELNISDNHEFFNTPDPTIFYHYEGQLLKNDGLILQRAKDKKDRELNKACKETILTGFYQEVDGIEYRFSYDAEAQANFAEALALFTEDIVSEVEWTAHRGINVEVITLNKQKFLTLIKAAFEHKSRAKAKYRKELYPLLMKKAKTPEDVKKIKWL